MADGDITLPKVGRRITALAGSVAVLTDKIASRDAADPLPISCLDRRVTVLETIVSRLTWTVVTAVVGAVLAVVLKVV